MAAGGLLTQSGLQSPPIRKKSPAKRPGASPFRRLSGEIIGIECNSRRIRAEFAEFWPGFARPKLLLAERSVKNPPVRRLVDFFARSEAPVLIARAFGAGGRPLWH